MKILMKNILKTLLIVICFFGGVACTDEFEDININPNAPETVVSSLLLPGVQRDMMNSLLNETWGIGNIVIQHTAKNQFVNEDRYLWGEKNTIWDAVYDNMRDVKNIIINSEANGQNNYKAIALIMKSWMFSLATDAYGDVPYSEATSVKDGINYPKYDKQEDIYTGILADLKTANDILGTSGEVVAGDLIFNGDIQKWKKAANSLRLRYLMRISKRKNVATDMQAILNDANSPIMTSNSDNVVYNYSASSPDQFPLASSRIGSFNEFRAGKTLLDYLQNLNDPRMKIFFRPTPATEGTPDTGDDVYVGIPNGLDDVAALEYNGGPQFQSRISATYFENSPSTGLNIAKGVMMTYAELQFVLAEAAEKGLVTGDAKTYYENGIHASFGFYALTTPAGYLTLPNVDYTGTQAQKLEKIGTQKWVSLFYQGLEAWFDWKRTNYPTLAPAVDNQNNDKIPVRFIYPINEQALNAQSRSLAVQTQGADDINTKVWWDMD
jgi:hypothetical protein